MEPTDLTIEILKDIREEARKTNERMTLSQIESRRRWLRSGRGGRRGPSSPDPRRTAERTCRHQQDTSLGMDCSFGNSTGRPLWCCTTRAL
jgi:hypothetical protein